MNKPEQLRILKTALALAVGSAIAWVVTTYSDKADFELRDTLPALCASALAVTWHRRLKDPSQGIVLAFVAGVAVALFSAVGEGLLYRTPMRLPVILFVALPDFLSVFLFLLVCSYFILRPGVLYMLAGAAAAAFLRILCWQIDVHSPMGTAIPLSLPQWSWLAGAALALLIWGEGTSPSPADSRWL